MSAVGVVGTRVPEHIQDQNKSSHPFQDQSTVLDFFLMEMGIQEFLVMEGKALTSSCTNSYLWVVIVLRTHDRLFILFFTTGFDR